MVKTYPDETAYEAAEKSKIESAVSLIESTGKAVFDGVNVVTDNPGVGDIVCYDENRKIKFIQLDTFQAGVFPSAWETVGVVVLRRGNKVTVCSKHNESHKFMEVYPYVVTGYELDGTEHTTQLRLHGKPSTSTYYEFKYSANTDEEFVAQLKQFLTDNGESDWSAYINGGEVWLQYDNYKGNESSNYTKSAGITLSPRITMDYPQNKNMMRKCGNSGFVSYVAARTQETNSNDKNDTKRNPNYTVTSIPDYVICYPAFCGTSQYRDKDYCLWLRQKYCKDPAHPTLEEWNTYVASLAPVIPEMVRMTAPQYRNGKRQTDNVRNIRYRDKEGNFKPLYSSVGYCSEFLDGKGYLPSVFEFLSAFSGITYGITGVEKKDADPINRSLYVIGGDSAGCNSNYWLNHAYTDLIGWHANYDGTITSYKSFYILKVSIQFADLDLSKLTD